MGSQEPNSSSLVDNVRNMSISRRGGIRTRGGRLPPIRTRDIPVVTAPKKVVAPKIPQRRVIKKERSEGPTPLIKKEPFFAKPEVSRGRGRGTKVFLQTEGTFLAQGPAAKIKKEPIDGPSYSVPRSSRSSAREKEVSKIDPDAINDLLDSYEAYGAYEDDLGCVPPYRLPLIKNGMIIKKKEEINEDIVKKEIKSEDDPWNKLEGKVYTKLKPKVKSDVEEFCNVKDEGMLILLHWPNCLPLANDQDDGKPQNEDKNNESEVSSSFIEKLPEGHVGKLQFLKSGKKRIVMGSMMFEFVEGAASQSSKEAVSVRADEDGGDVIIIGKIDRTMVLIPLIDSILADEKNTIV